jgi:SAM-dependent methyltransferase
MPPSSQARQQAAAVLGTDPAHPLAPDGYLDLLAGEPPASGLAQRLMLSRAVPAIYERWWRPALTRLAEGPRGLSLAREVTWVRRVLAAGEGAMALDLACGTGRLARALASDVGSAGTVVGVDAAATMLARAAAATEAGNVVYARADLTDLAVCRGCVDAVCCVAALHLVADPHAVLATVARTLAPGGRLALLTTRRPERLPPRVSAGLGRLAGLAVVTPGWLADALADCGLEVAEQHPLGLLQLAGARKP